MRRLEGFTLVEILVATVIILFSIATLSALINSANQTEIKTSDRLELLAQVPTILTSIKLNIRLSGKPNTLSGEGATPNTQYSWRATLASSSGPANVLPNASETSLSGQNTFKLYNVDLQVWSGNVSRDYTFSVLAWESGFE